MLLLGTRDGRNGWPRGICAGLGDGQDTGEENLEATAQRSCKGTGSSQITWGVTVRSRQGGDCRRI